APDAAEVSSFEKIVPAWRNRMKLWGITVGLGGCFGRVDCGKSEERNLGPGRHPGWRIHPGAHVSDRRGAGYRENHDQNHVLPGESASQDVVQAPNSALRFSR